MTFFNWTPSEDNQIVSPWVALYFGLTGITTVFALLYWNRRKTYEEWDSKEQFIKDLEGARNWMNLATLSRSDIEQHDAEDAESEDKAKAPILY